MSALAEMTSDLRRPTSPPAGTAGNEPRAAERVPRRDAADSSPARRISRRLAERIGAHKYDMWFGRTRLQVDGKRVEVATDSPFVASWIDSHYAADLRGIACEALGDSATIEVKIATESAGGVNDDDQMSSGAMAGVQSAEPTADRSKDQALKGRAKRSDRDRRAPLRRLDDFVVGASNKLAFTAARQIAEGLAASGGGPVVGISPLFLHGECGVGKTHLLQGICQRFSEATGRPHAARYVTGEQFTNEYIMAVKGSTIDHFRQRIRRLELLAIDDVHFLANKQRTQSEFLHTLDAIDLTGARVVLASDDHPRHIQRFSQALVSRFLAGMVVRIDRPDRAMRAEIIRRLAAQRSLAISPAAVDHVAANCAGSVRELEGAITKLTALHMLANGDGRANGQSEGEVGVLLAEQVFKDQAWKPATPVRMTTVIESVCLRLSVSKAELVGSGRHRRIVLARALVAYLGRELTTQSFPEIAHVLGRTCHSTVHTADARLRRQMHADECQDLGGAERQVNLRELADQLRQDVMRAAARQ